MRPTSRNEPYVARGAWRDRVTQVWVRFTGRRIDVAENEWLRAPVGDVDRIGEDFFHRLAERTGLRIDPESRPRGILDRIAVLDGPTCDTSTLHPGVIAFYEHTSEYDFEVRSHWSPWFRPFGVWVARIFSRRLQQLDVPLGSDDSIQQYRSTVLKLRDTSGAVRHTAWIRSLRSTGAALYVGEYSTCVIPHDGTTCVKVSFPLPNGSATVILRPETTADSALVLRSSGRGFGDAGFYFFVTDGHGGGWARYVRTLREELRVYVDDQETLRAEHSLRLWGLPVLRMRYRMRKSTT